MVKTVAPLPFLLATASAPAQASRVPPRFLSACAYLLTFLLLAAGSRELWQHRFASQPGAEPLVLGHQPPKVLAVLNGDVTLPARGGTLGMTAAAIPPCVQFRWFTVPPAPYAYISMEAGCEDLVQGTYDWDDARITLVWFDQNGNRLPDHLPIWSARGTRPVAFREVVVPLGRRGGLPCLMIENLGSRGHLTLKSLTVQPVVERPWLRPAIVALTLAWLIFLYFTIRHWISPRVAWWQIFAAAAVCVAFAWLSAFPGPWMPLQPLHQRFAVTPVPLPKPPPPAVPGPPSPAPDLPAPPPPEPKPLELPAYPPEAKGPAQKLSGSTVRWFVGNLPKLKIWVHFVAFAGLTAVLAFLTGTRRAAYLAGALGFLSEFCEWAFGFGVDWGDAGDLAMDAAAILAGMLAWKYAMRAWTRNRRKRAALFQGGESLQ